MEIAMALTLFLVGVFLSWYLALTTLEKSLNGRGLV